MSRFLVSGGVSFAVEYAVFIVLLKVLETRAGVASSVSFLLGLATSYMLNMVWTFKAKSYALNRFARVLLYLLLALINLYISYWLVDQLHKGGFSPFLAKVLSVVLIAVSNYVIFKKLIFKVKKTQANSIDISI